MISITTRPRQQVYINSGSPGVPVWSNWNAAWNTIVYTFNVEASDVASGIRLSVYESGTNTLLIDAFMRPYKLGSWNVDIAPYLRSYLFSKYQTNFTLGDNCGDLGNSLTFYITYQQIYDNATPSVFSTEITRPIIACCSALQFGDQYGENMREYTPFNKDLDEEYKAKFLTAFKRPVMFKGFPFTLSFIYNYDLVGVQVEKVEQQNDTNDSPLEIETIDLDPTKIGTINYLNIKEPDQQHCKSITTFLQTGNEIENYYVDPGYVDSGYEQVL